MVLFAVALAVLLPTAALKPPPIPRPGPPPAATARKAPTSEEAREDELAERLPPEQRAQYETFAAKCGRCHSEHRALGAAYTADEWDDYLRRKYRRAGAGISERQMQAIGAFLRYWAGAKR